MIPHSITLSNFLSYGSLPQTVSFEGFNLVCLSGKNGHGKSALLDAMTWALWGQARKTTGTSKPDEGLLRLGARSMMVVFEFFVAGNRYRVRREFAIRQGNKHAVTVDIAVYDQASDSFKSLTEKTIRATQATIESIIGLDYETYTNSAFFRQGNANEFSQKSPKDRKKILATILGVDRYDALQSFALEHARTYADQIAIVEQFIASDEQELSGHSELVVRYEACVEQMQVLDAQLVLAEKQHLVAQRSYDSFIARLREVQQHRDEYRAQQAAHKKACNEWLERASRYRKEVCNARCALASLVLSPERRSELEKQEQEWRAKQRDFMTTQHALMDAQKVLLERQHGCEQRFNERRRDLSVIAHEALTRFDAKKTAYEHSVKVRAQEEHELSLMKSHVEACAREIEHAQTNVAAGALTRAQFEKRKLFYTTYVPRLKWLAAEQEELVKKQEMALEGGEGACPLCEQLLTLKRRQFLEERLRCQSHRIAHQHDRLHRVLSALKELLKFDHERIKALDQQEQELHKQKAQHEALLQQQQQQQVRLAVHSASEQALKQEMESAAHVHAQAAAALEAHDSTREALFDGDQGIREARAVVAKHEAQKADCGYREELHMACEQELADMRAQGALFEVHRENLHAAAVERSALKEQWRQQRKERLLLADKERQLASITLDPALEPELGKALEHEQARCTQMRQEKEQLAVESGQLSSSLERLALRRVAIKERKKEIDELRQKQHDCTLLAGAWGKNGIQALLIEQSIPELEHEANELLARLSGNQTHVFIESLRDLKRGGVRETLDIKIADSVGIRPYELFSGGEAFRIDFALRIAISKLLCRRVGASLQVLIIDEGFGSQDDEGLARLMQALYTVQDDFAKIIIVSHLPHFKDNFPVHFLVEKGSTGSVITIEERG